MLAKPISSHGRAYRRLQAVPADRWAFFDPTATDPAGIEFRDKGGIQTHAIPYYIGCSVTLLRVRDRGAESGITLCLVLDADIPYAHLLKYTPSDDFVAESMIDTIRKQRKMLTYPPNREPARPPTLDTLSDIVIVKRMALYLEPAGTFWSASTCQMPYREDVLSARTVSAGELSNRQLPLLDEHK